MSFLETLLSGNSAKERKEKKICAIAIVVTAFILVVALIAFTICMVVDATAGMNSNNDKDKESEEEIVNIGELASKELSESAIKMRLSRGREMLKKIIEKEGHHVR